jgi:hypothetical protein
VYATEEGERSHLAHVARHAACCADGTRLALQRWHSALGLLDSGPNDPLKDWRGEGEGEDEGEGDVGGERPRCERG